MLIGLMTTGVSAVEPAQDQTPQTTKTVTDAILYTVDESGNLEYNVVYGARIANTVQVADATKGGSIDTLVELNQVLGEPDETPKELTDTPHTDRTLGDAVVADLTITAMRSPPLRSPTSGNAPSSASPGRPITLQIKKTIGASPRPSSATAPKSSSCLRWRPTQRRRTSSPASTVCL